MQKIGFVGAGKMAQALAGGIAKANPLIRFVIVDPDFESQARFRERTVGARKNGIKESVDASLSTLTCVKTCQEVFDACDLIFLAIKPQMAEIALANLRVSDPNLKLIVSVMAGITTEKIQKLSHQQKVIRVMPNTPCLIGMGASAMACTENVSEKEAELVFRYLESVGTVERVEEGLLDSVTGLSGSGPAYVFSFIESLIRGGIAAGLDPQISDRLARQTVLGAVTLLNQLDATPADLRKQVTSPGGTTLAGLEQLEKFGFDEAIVQAVLRATERARELGRN